MICTDCLPAYDINTAIRRGGRWYCPTHPLIELTDNNALTVQEAVKKIGFEIGDFVVKARPYSKKKYCFYGGSERDTPIGVKGEVRDVSDTTTAVTVNFPKVGDWTVHPSELDLHIPRSRRVLIKANRVTD